MEGDDEGMYRISLVDAPAVRSDFLKFSEQRAAELFRVEDEDKRLVYGVVMRADYPIYRVDAAGNGFYMVFKADTIRRMARKYLAEGRQNEVSLMHADGEGVEGVEMVQFFIKDTAKGVNPAGFDDIADGSLFAEFKVLDDSVWQAVKDGTLRGFSLEGIFDLSPETDEDWTIDIVKATRGLFRELLNPSKNMNNKIERFKAALAKIMSVALGQITTDKGIIEWDGDEEIKAGDTVWQTSEEGERVKPEDGAYAREDGTIITVTDGVVESIAEPEAPADETVEETPAETEAETEEEAEEEPAAEEVPNPDEPGEESDTKAIEEIRKELDELYAKYDELVKTVEALRGDVEGKFAAINKTPAAESAHDEYKKANKEGLSDLEIAKSVRNAKW